MTLAQVLDDEEEARRYLSVALGEDLLGSTVVVREGIRGVTVLIEDMRVRDLA